MKNQSKKTLPRQSLEVDGKLRLMDDFNCEDADEMLNPALSEHVRYYKETKGGLKKMSRLVEEYGQMMAEEAAKEAEKERESSCR